MQQFDVCFGYAKYSESAEQKERPVILLDSAKQREKVVVLPIYSYRKWFDSPEVMATLLEVLDLDSAGLRRRSFVGVTRGFLLDKREASAFKKLGHLSSSDINALISKFEEL